MAFSKKNLFESFEDDAQERRNDREWELGPDCPEEGLKAHALLEWLRNNGDVSVRTPEQTERYVYLKNRLEELENSDNEESEDEISDIEKEIIDLEDAIDVYDIVPSGKFYNMDEFEVPSVYNNRRYAVGTEYETKESAEDSVRSLWNELGTEAFSLSFIKNHLDEDKVVEMAESSFSDDVYNNPEAYFDDSMRELSSKQEETIRILELRISQLQDKLSDYSESELDLEDEIEQIEEMISELEEEIESEKDDPKGEFPDHLFQRKIEDLVDDVRDDPESYLDNLGMDISDFVDEDSLIEDVVDTDGYGHILNSYDGNADEIKVLNDFYWVMRID